MCRLSSVNGACIRLLTLLFLFIWIHRSQEWSHESKLSDSVCTSPSPGNWARWRKVQWIQRDKQKRHSTKDNNTDICFIYIQWYKILSSDPSSENLGKLYYLLQQIVVMTDISLNNWLRAKKKKKEEYSTEWKRLKKKRKRLISEFNRRGIWTIHTW